MTQPTQPTTSWWVTKTDAEFVEAFKANRERLEHEGGGVTFARPPRPGDTRSTVLVIREKPLRTLGHWRDPLMFNPNRRPMADIVELVDLESMGW